VSQWSIDIEKEVVAVTTDNAQNVRNAIIDCLQFHVLVTASVQDGHSRGAHSFSSDKEDRYPLP